LFEYLESVPENGSCQNRSHKLVRMLKKDGPVFLLVTGAG
jgi:hypothetical protein